LILGKAAKGKDGFELATQGEREKYIHYKNIDKFS
jgi:hypothetical protein